uniref:Uncharacterized protein n=1 Tax=Arundo donax TaxID=35708 RepID=A0A0A9F2I1_ARUDO
MIDTCDSFYIYDRYM